MNFCLLVPRTYLVLSFIVNDTVVLPHDVLEVWLVIGFLHCGPSPLVFCGYRSKVGPCIAFRTSALFRIIDEC
jgi:hypothetical protein